MTSFIIKFPDGSFLRPCLVDVRTLTTARHEAKRFDDEMRAKTWATLLGGCVEEIETRFEMACFSRESGDDMDDLGRVLDCFVRNSGGIFQGLQSSLDGRPALVLFAPADVPKERQITLAVPIFQLSTETVHRRIQEAQQKFAPKIQEASA